MEEKTEPSKELLLNNIARLYMKLDDLTVEMQEVKKQIAVHRNKLKQIEE